jgi:hypothetical protein
MKTGKLYLTMGALTGARKPAVTPALETPVQLLAAVVAAAALTIAAAYATHLGFDALGDTSLKRLTAYESAIQHGLFLVFAGSTITLLLVHTGRSLIRAWKAIRQESTVVRSAERS